MANVQYAFVDVWNCRAVLSWTVFSEDGNSSHVERLTDEEQRRLNITEDVLYDAIEVAGGSISMSGHNPISMRSGQSWRRMSQPETIQDKLPEERA
jgi:hypothetical protein